MYYLYLVSFVSFVPCISCYWYVNRPAKHRYINLRVSHLTLYMDEGTLWSPKAIYIWEIGGTKGEGSRLMRVSKTIKTTNLVYSTGYKLVCTDLDLSYCYLEYILNDIFITIISVSLSYSFFYILFLFPAFSIGERGLDWDYYSVKGAFHAGCWQFGGFFEKNRSTHPLQGKDVSHI